MSEEISSAVRDLAQAQLARDHLLDFAMRMDKNYVDAKHVRHAIRATR